MSSPNDYEANMPQVSVEGLDIEAIVDDRVKSVFAELGDIDWSTVVFNGSLNVDDFMDLSEPLQDREVASNDECDMSNLSTSAEELVAEENVQDPVRCHRALILETSDCNGPSQSLDLHTKNRTEAQYSSFPATQSPGLSNQDPAINHDKPNNNQQAGDHDPQLEKGGSLPIDPVLGFPARYTGALYVSNGSLKPVSSMQRVANPQRAYQSRGVFPRYYSQYPDLHDGAELMSIERKNDLSSDDDGLLPNVEHSGYPSHTTGENSFGEFAHDFGSDSDSSELEAHQALTQTMSRPTGQLTRETHKGASKAPSRRQTFKSLQLTRRNPGYHPNKLYKPLRRAPKTWGAFSYTPDGELEPSHLFTPEEITSYLFQHPLHNQAQSKSHSKLIIWIHRNPPDSASRFPTIHGSHRCRFRDCPSQNNTINQGQFACIFDELSVDHPHHDPFLNAGWVHLYCLERFCNFPKICRYLNVQPEKRYMPYETSKNKGNNCMRLDKIRGLESVVNNFIGSCRAGTLPMRYPRFNERDCNGEPYAGTLCHRLCLKKQRSQPGGVNRQEAARQKAAGRPGATLSIHLGNLMVEDPIRRNTRRHKNQIQLVANPRQRRWYKYGTIEDDSDDESGYSDADNISEDEAEMPGMLLAASPHRASTIPPSVGKRRKGDDCSSPIEIGESPLKKPRYDWPIYDN